jgi:hypothetical protein
LHITGDAPSDSCSSTTYFEYIRKQRELGFNLLAHWGRIVYQQVAAPGVVTCRNDSVLAGWKMLRAVFSSWAT